MMTIVQDVMNENPLYTSDSDVQQPDIQPQVFTPAEPVQMTINPPVQLPVVNMTTPMTIIPQATVQAIDVSNIPQDETVIVDVPHLAQVLDADTAAKVAADIQSGNPIPEDIASVLVVNNIVSYAQPVDVAPAVTVPVLPTNTATQVEGNVEKPVKTKTKKSFLDRITNYIYKIIY